MNSKLTKLIIMCAISLNMLIAADVEQKTPEKTLVISPASQKLIAIFASVNRKLDQVKLKIKETKDRVTIERLKTDYREQRQKLLAGAVKIAIKLEQNLKAGRNQEKLIESEIVETQNEIKKLEPEADSIAGEKYYQARWKLRLFGRKLQILKSENDWNAKIILLLKQGQKKSSVN